MIVPTEAKGVGLQCRCPVSDSEREKLERIARRLAARWEWVAFYRACRLMMGGLPVGQPAAREKTLDMLYWLGARSAFIRLMRAEDRMARMARAARGARFLDRVARFGHLARGGRRPHREWFAKLGRVKMRVV